MGRGFCQLFFLTAAVLGAAEIARGQDQNPDESVAYLFVIDRSGSMALGPNGEGQDRDAPAYRGPTRWEILMEKAKANIDSLRENSVVWVCSFNGYDDKSDVDDVFRIRQFYIGESSDKAAIKAYFDDPSANGIGAPGGNTALYDALAKTLQRAEQFAETNRGNSVTVYFYTDGEDNRSRDFASLDDVESLYSSFVKNEKLNFYLIQLDREFISPPDWANRARKDKTQISLQLVQDQFLLDSPVRSPAQSIKLRFLSTAEAWKRVTGIRGTATFAPSGGSDIAIEPVSFELREGDIELRLNVMNSQDLVPNQAYSGVLTLTFDETSQYELLTDSANEVELGFRKGDQLEIFGLNPASGTVWALGTPIDFSLVTTDGAQVVWDFGEGRTLVGSSVKYAFQSTGEKEIAVSVEGTRAEIGTSAIIRLKVIDLPVAFDLADFPVFAGQEVELTGTGSLDIARFEWLIDGQTFPANEVNQSADQNRISIKHRFSSPGEVPVQLLGYAELLQTGDKRLVSSPTRNLTVLPNPSIKLSPENPIDYSNQPVALSVDMPRTDLRTTTWRMDGKAWKANVDEVNRTFDMVGEYSVELEVVWSNGQSQLLEKRIDVVAEAVESKPAFELNGETNRVFPGSTIMLIDASTGDVVSHRWMHTKPGATAPELLDSESAVVNEIGEHRFELTVLGPNRKSDQMPSSEDSAAFVIEVLRPPFWLGLWALLGVSLLALGLAARLLFFNQPRSWRLQYDNSDRVGNESPYIHILGKDTSFRWNWLYKVGRLPIKRLVNTPYWNSGGGKDAVLKISQSPGSGQPEVKYSRSDRKVRTARSEGGETEFHKHYTFEDRSSGDPADHQFSILIDFSPGRYRRTLSWIMWLAALGACAIANYLYYENYIRL